MAFKTQRTPVRNKQSVPNGARMVRRNDTKSPKRGRGVAPGSYQTSIAEANKRLSEINKTLNKPGISDKTRKALMKERKETTNFLRSLSRGERRNIKIGNKQEKMRIKSVTDTINSIARGLTGETATVGGSVVGSKAVSSRAVSPNSKLVDGPMVDQNVSTGRDEESDSTATSGDYDFVNNLGGFGG